MARQLPSPGQFVDDELEQLFSDSIDQLISDIGRFVKLFFKPISTGCPNCFSGPDGKSNGKYDTGNPNILNGPLNKPFPSGGVCPVCRGSHKILTENSKSYKAAISRAPKDINYDATGINPSNVVSTHMISDAYHDLLKTEKAIIDGELFVKLREPVKLGLRDLKYVRVWWVKQT